MYSQAMNYSQGQPQPLLPAKTKDNNTQTPRLKEADLFQTTCCISLSLYYISLSIYRFIYIIADCVLYTDQSIIPTPIYIYMIAYCVFYVNYDIAYDIVYMYVVCCTVRRYSTRYARYKQYIDKDWTSFLSPIRSRCYFRTTFYHFSGWNCVPHLFYACGEE